MSLLEVKDLHTSFMIPAGEVKAVNGVSFSLDEGKVLGIVGESGSGKSVTAYSIMQILAQNGKIVSGSIKYKGKELVGASKEEMAAIRGDKICIIFQDPMSSLNPVYTVGNQLTEAILVHSKKKLQNIYNEKKIEALAEIEKLSAELEKGSEDYKAKVKEIKNNLANYKPRKVAYNKSIEMLTLVGVNEPKKRMKQYPFEFSGGMMQRVMIAMALVGEPDILIADEPTTALDVTIQAQILELLKELQVKLKMAIMIITHDLGVVAQICDEVDVMYAGKIVERGTIDAVFYNPQHEYTKGLIKSIPSLNSGKSRLLPISGNPVDVMCLPEGCAFAPRCDACMQICIEKYPDEIDIEPFHRASCFNAAKILHEIGKIDVTKAPQDIEKNEEVE